MPGAGVAFHVDRLPLIYYHQRIYELERNQALTWPRMNGVMLQSLVLPLERLRPCGSSQRGTAQKLRPRRHKHFDFFFSVPTEKNVPEAEIRSIRT